MDTAARHLNHFCCQHPPGGIGCLVAVVSKTDQARAIDVDFVHETRGASPIEGRAVGAVMASLQFPRK